MRTTCVRNREEVSELDPREPIAVVRCNTHRDDYTVVFVTDNPEVAATAFGTTAIRRTTCTNWGTSHSKKSAPCWTRRSIQHDETGEG